MTDALPVEIRRRTLAGTLRYVVRQLTAAVPDYPQRLALTLALESAAERAQTEAEQAAIWRGEAADRERALAAVQRVRAEMERIALLLPPEAEGEYWVLGLIREALDEPNVKET